MWDSKAITPIKLLPVVFFCQSQGGDTISYCFLSFFFFLRKSLLESFRKISHFFQYNDHIFVSWKEKCHNKHKNNFVNFGEIKRLENNIWIFFKKNLTVGLLVYKKVYKTYGMQHESSNECVSLAYIKKLSLCLNLDKNSHF